MRHWHLSFGLMAGDVHNPTSRLDLIYLSTCKSHTPHLNEILCLSTCWRSKHIVSVCFYEIYMKKRLWAFVTHDTQRHPISSKKDTGIMRVCVWQLDDCSLCVFADVLIVSVLGTGQLKACQKQDGRLERCPTEKQQVWMFSTNYSWSV